MRLSILEYSYIFSYRNTQAFVPGNRISLSYSPYRFQRGIIEIIFAIHKNSLHNKVRVKNAFFIELEE
jgi:hypothetical protein